MIILLILCSFFICSCNSTPSQPKKPKESETIERIPVKQGEPTMQEALEEVIVNEVRKDFRKVVKDLEPKQKEVKHGQAHQKS